MLERIGNFFKSSPLPWALCILILANLVFFAWNPFRNVDPEALPIARNWIWWSVHEYLEWKGAPNVVVCGSSIVMHPLWHHEADYRQQPVDFVADHRSRFLEDVIARSSGIKDLKCFNFGLPGCMASDDYMVVKSMFKADKKPEIMILGICPRDMIDNRFNCAGSSKHFQYLSRFTDARGLLDLSMPNWWQRIGYLTTESIYFAGKAQAAQVIFGEALKTFLQPEVAGLPASPLDLKTEHDKQFAMYQNLVEKGFWIAKPNAPINYVPDLSDLPRRYGHPNTALFKNQKKWLDLCLENCHKMGVKVVLVNMPNTTIARAGMPPGVYDRHVACLKEMANKWNCLFVDADVPNYYEQQHDFTDCFHLSANGGKKAFELIGRAIGNDRDTVANLPGGDSTRVASRTRVGM